MASKILNFSPDRLITGINIVDNMLFFTDNVNEPKKINITKFRGDATEGEFKNIPVDHSSGTTRIYNRFFEERDITVIKEHPILGANSKRIDIPTGVEDDDFKPEEVDTDPKEVIATDPALDNIHDPTEPDKSEDNTEPIEEISNRGVLYINGTSPSPLSNIEITADAIKGAYDILEVYFIYSQTKGSSANAGEAIADLVTNVSATGPSKEIKGSEVDFTSWNKSNGKSSIVLQSTDSTRPGYDSTLTAGKLYVTAYMKVKGVSEKIFTNRVVTIDLVAATHSGETLLSPVILNPLEITNKNDFGANVFLSAKVDDIGKNHVISSGFYVIQDDLSSKATYTNQNIINNGEKHSPVGSNHFGSKLTFSWNLPFFNNKRIFVIPFVTTEFETAYGTLSGNALVLSGSTDRGELEIYEGDNPNPQSDIVITDVDPEILEDEIIIKQSWPGAEIATDNGTKEAISERGIFTAAFKLDLGIEGAKDWGKNLNSFTPGKATEGTYKIETHPATLDKYQHSRDALSFSIFSNETFGQKIAFKNPNNQEPKIDEFSTKFFSVDQGKSYWELEKGDIITYRSYTIGADTGKITLGPIKFVEVGEIVQNATFNVSEITYELDKDSLNSYGTHRVEVDLKLNLFELPANETLKDINIVFSKPSSKQEYLKTENKGTWQNVDDIIGARQRTIKTKDDATFSSHLGSSSLGQYTFNNISLPALVPADYYISVENGIKLPIYPDFPYRGVAQVTTDKNTYYSEIFPTNSFDLNQNLLGEEGDVLKNNKAVIGGPMIFTDPAVTSLTSTGVTLNSFIDRTGKDILETGFYYSTVNPSASPSQTGRSRTLDTWAQQGTTTKIASTKTVTEVNTHLDQEKGVTNNISEYLKSSSNVTGLSANTTYYFASYTKPVQSADPSGDKVVPSATGGNYDTFNDLVDGIKWGDVFSFTTDKNVSTVSTGPVFFQHEPVSGYLDYDSITLGGQAQLKDVEGGRIVEYGFYAKPASEFSQPFSDQAGNASTMQSATNRLAVTVPPIGAGYEINTRNTGRIELKIEGVSFVEYWVSIYVKVDINGTETEYISEYISVDNSVNANHNVLEATSVQTSGIKGNTLLTTAYFPPNWGSDKAPRVSTHGAYFVITDNSEDYPLSVNQFFALYNAASQSNKALVENTESIHGGGGGFSNASSLATINIQIPEFASPDHWPLDSALSGKRVHAQAFYKYRIPDGNIQNPSYKTIYAESPVTMYRMATNETGHRHLRTLEHAFRPAGADIKNIYFKPINGTTGTYYSANIQRNFDGPYRYKQYSASTFPIPIAMNPKGGKSRFQYKQIAGEGLKKWNVKVNEYGINLLQVNDWKSGPFGGIFLLWGPNADIEKDKPIDYFIAWQNLNDDWSFTYPEEVKGVSQTSFKSYLPNPFN